MDRSVASPSYHPIQETRRPSLPPPAARIADAFCPLTLATAATMAAIFGRPTARCCVGWSVERDFLGGPECPNGATPFILGGVSGNWGQGNGNWGHTLRVPPLPLVVSTVSFLDLRESP
jgi:hypothetical protein